MLMVSAAFLFGIEVDFLISPYKGTFRVSQAYRNLRANGTYHQGYDLVGIGDKSIYCPVYGTVIRAGWECATLPKKVLASVLWFVSAALLLYVFWASVQNQRGRRAEAETGRSDWC